MVVSRRNFFKTALAMPVAASFMGYEALAAAEKGQVKITAIKTIALKEKRGSSRGLVKIETDAGVVGYGPSEGGPDTRVAIGTIANGPDGLIGKDPLSIHVHFHNMFYAHAQRPENIRAYSGVDMALWDLAGKILNQPVSKLLGGNFRDEIDTYSHLLPPSSKPDAYRSAERLPQQGCVAEEGADIEIVQGRVQSVQDRHSPFARRPQRRIYARSRSAGSRQSPPRLRIGPRGAGVRLRHRRSLPQRTRSPQRDQGWPGGGGDQADVLRRSSVPGVLGIMGGAPAGPRAYPSLPEKAWR